MVYKTLVLFLALVSLQFKESVTQEFEEHFYTGGDLQQGRNEIAKLRGIKETFLLYFKTDLTSENEFTVSPIIYQSDNTTKLFSCTLVKSKTSTFFEVFTDKLKKIEYKANAQHKWSNITISQLKLNLKYILQIKVNDEIIYKEASDPKISSENTVYFSLELGEKSNSNFIKDIYIATGRMNPCKSEEWKYFEGFCYWSSLYQTGYQQSNWFNAAKDCLQKKSHIVSILTANENDMVYTLNTCVDSWTGLVLTDSSAKTSTGWQWFDNSQSSYTNWNKITAYFDRSGCSYLSNADGSWQNNLHCANNKNYYVCKKPATGSRYLSNSLELFNLNSDCNDGWFGLGNKCYFKSLSKTDYFEALIQCQSMASQIVSIKSSKEGADLTRIFNSCETPWIGLENTNPNNVKEISSWKWSDGTGITYQNWIDKGIYDDKQKQCGVLKKGAKWENVYCWEEHPFICQKNK